MRALGELLKGLVPDATRTPFAAQTVGGVAEDSRRVVPGGIFVAVRGTAADGRDYIADAVRRGATVIVGEDVPSVEDVVCINVPDARVALATLALRWHDLTDDALRDLDLLGVTGTNGKSTTAVMTRAILQAAGRRCGLLGTIRYDLGLRSVTAGMTTPAAPELAAYLRECVDTQSQAVVMEVSSHAIDQRRVHGLRFTAAAFTNLSGDHLDYHGTLDAYRDTKARLFADLEDDAVALVNRDDPAHAAMTAGCRARVVAYALDAPADIRGYIVRSTSQGTYYRVQLEGRELVLENAIVGRYNVYNALAAIGLARAVGVEFDAIERGLSAVRNIPGRLQRVPCGLEADVFVDYAHTDDALRNVLGVLKPLTKGRLIVVFGCGGDRDKTKRPRMAEAAEELADVIVVTSDNPRTEDPDAIIADIMAGFSNRDAVRVDADRTAAIRSALADVGPGDIVLIAGKGHENYQVVGTQRVHFDDVEVAIQMAAARKSEEGAE